jgi:aryl-alcohol dehydrogenase-like predicted oxidoreductase
MTVAAARYPLSFPEVSTVIMGTKTVAQAQDNYGSVPGAGLSATALSGVFEQQRALGLHSRQRAILDALRRIVSG